MFYYDYVNEWKMDKIHIYRFIVYHLFEIKTVHPRHAQDKPDIATLGT
jgi:hypothetical protein